MAMEGNPRVAVIGAGIVGTSIALELRKRGAAVTLVDRDGAQQVVDAAYLFVFIGAAPLTDWLPAELVRDQSGFVVTGPELVAGGRRPDAWDLDRDPYLLESSIPGVFVAGDVRAQSVKRVASAVGEGALAVTLVHRYLARGA